MLHTSSLCLQDRRKVWVLVLSRLYVPRFKLEAKVESMAS